MLLSLDVDSGPSNSPVPITISSCSEVKCAVNEFLGELSRFSWQKLLRESWVTTCRGKKKKKNGVLFNFHFSQVKKYTFTFRQTGLNYKVLGQVP